MKEPVPKILKKLLKQSGHSLEGIEQVQGERFFIISNEPNMKYTRTDMIKVMMAADIERGKAMEAALLIVRSLADALTAGKVIELRGLGSFIQRQRKARTRFDPRNRNPVYVPEGRCVIFKLSKNLRNKLREETPMQ